MGSLNLIPIFMTGLMGGVHCIGMCGGIASALSVATPRRSARPDFPIAVTVEGYRQSGAASAESQTVVLAAAYNAGRIGSYMLAGAVAGGMAGGARILSGASGLQAGGYWLANAMLILIGLHLMDAWQGLARLEAVGQKTWRKIQPLMRHVLPADTPGKALILGGLWGWVPCGMVYSVLVTAMLSGSALSGASVMLAFGVGTLPALLAVGMAGARVRAWSQRRAVRLTGGAVVIAFGVLGIVRAMNGLPHRWTDLLCVGAGI